MKNGHIGIIGGGPAGLMAAEAASGAGAAVTLFEAMPTVGRKLLMAGKSGLNITHSEGTAQMLARFGTAQDVLAPAIEAFDGAALRDWCAGLGIETFVGSSGRVFPRAMKASPLLRAWLGRLAYQGVEIRTRHHWAGFDGKALVIDTPSGRMSHDFDAVVLALGGASWPQLGSDAAWVPWLSATGVAVKPFMPANCGFEVAWSETFATRFAGAPVKSVFATSDAGQQAGEFVVTSWGIEGSLVYAHSAQLRDRLAATGKAVLGIDLVPGRDADRLQRDLARQPAKASFSNRLRKGVGLDGVKAGLVRELVSGAGALAPEDLAQRIKALELPVLRPRPIAEAISSAGGVDFAGLDANLMIEALPGWFVAGEMLDWEAPTGGYLLTASMATGKMAGLAAARYAMQGS